MDNPIRPYLYEIGKALDNLGYELCQQANAPEPLNIHGQVKQAVDNLCYNLHNLSADLDTYRFDLIKNGESEDISKNDIETITVAMQHILHSSPYTHNGERTTLAGELHKLDYIVSSIYRLMAHGAVGRQEYLFDKITVQEK